MLVVVEVLFLVDAGGRLICFLGQGRYFEAGVKENTILLKSFDLDFWSRGCFDSGALPLYDCVDGL